MITGGKIKVIVDTSEGGDGPWIVRTMGDANRTGFLGIYSGDIPLIVDKVLPMASYFLEFIPCNQFVCTPVG